MTPRAQCHSELNLLSGHSADAFNLEEIFNWFGFYFLKEILQKWLNYSNERNC